VIAAAFFLHEASFGSQVSKHVRRRSQLRFNAHACTPSSIAIGAIGDAAASPASAKIRLADPLVPARRQVRRSPSRQRLSERFSMVDPVCVSTLMSRPMPSMIVANKRATSRLCNTRLSGLGKRRLERLVRTRAARPPRKCNAS
jgi:hypothetical protein